MVVAAPENHRRIGTNGIIGASYPKYGFEQEGYAHDQSPRAFDPKKHASEGLYLLDAVCFDTWRFAVLHRSIWFEEYAGNSQVQQKQMVSGASTNCHGDRAY